jgi:RNA polymerase sigma-70 factor (ECF subfamily)
MAENAWLANGFEANRSHLRGVAYRMLGSLSDADDAVQEAWIRFSRTDTGAIADLRAWLTTVVGRVCLNMLRSRKTRREVSLESHIPDPIVSPLEGIDPEREALLGASVGLALVVVLDSLTPAERVAFVLHDIFAIPFEVIAPIVGRTPTAGRQSASRARRQVQARPCPMSISMASGPSSTPSWLLRVKATSRRCSPSSIRTSCCAPTAGWRVRS